jgi:hypothetical protein
VKKKINIVVLMIFVLLMFSCKVVFVNKGKSENLRPTKLYKSLVDNAFEFENMTLKFSAELINGEASETFSGIIRIQRDSIIWLSLRSYNIEGARVCITQDSVKYLNRIDNTYYLGDFAFLTDRFQIDLDYKTLESILSNNFFFYPAPEDTAKAINDFKPCEDSVYHCMSSISKRKYVRYYIDDKGQERIDRRIEKESQDTAGRLFNRYESDELVYQIVKVVPELYRVHDVYVENQIQQQSLYILYGKQTLVETQFFPSEITIELVTPKFETKLVLTVESVTVNTTDMSYPFKISDKYQQIIIE